MKGAVQLKACKSDIPKISRSHFGVAQEYPRLVLAGDDPALCFVMRRRCGLLC